VKMTRAEIEERWLVVTGNITDTSEGYFSKAASTFALDMVCLQEKRTIEEIENRAIILSNEDGAGILMLPLDEWATFKKEEI